MSFGPRRHICSAYTRYSKPLKWPWAVEIVLGFKGGVEDIAFHAAKQVHDDGQLGRVETYAKRLRESGIGHLSICLGQLPTWRLVGYLHLAKGCDIDCILWRIEHRIRREKQQEV
jgi:hypothetical protein